MPEFAASLRKGIRVWRCRASALRSHEDRQPHTPAPESCEASLRGSSEGPPIVSIVQCMAAIGGGNQDLKTDVPKWKMPPERPEPSADDGKSPFAQARFSKCAVG